MSFEDRLERYAMQLETMTETGKLWVNASEIGTALGLDPYECLILSHYLEDAGWVQIMQASPEEGTPALKLRLNLAGRRQVAKLHWPRWRRWVQGNPALAVAVLALASSVVVPLLLRLIPTSPPVVHNIIQVEKPKEPAP